MRFSTKLKVVTHFPDHGTISLLETNGFNVQLTNFKLQASRVPSFSQVTFLPESVLESGARAFIGKGSLSTAQGIACGNSCAFRTKSLGGLGGCYVNHELRTKAEKAKKYSTNNTPALVGGILRLSVWGDASKVPRDYIEALFQEYDAVLGYVSGFRATPYLAGRVQASCQTGRDVDDAVALGFSPYLGTVEAINRARELGLVVYGCPISSEMDILKKGFGCSECPIFCDGTRTIAAPKPFRAWRDAQQK